jgi:hypothetical protein
MFGKLLIDIVETGVELTKITGSLVTDAAKVIPRTLDKCIEGDDVGFLDDTSEAIQESKRKLGE